MISTVPLGGRAVGAGGRRQAGRQGAQEGGDCRKLGRMAGRTIMSASRIRGKLLPFAVSIEVPILSPRAFSVLAFSRLAHCLALAVASLVLALPSRARRIAAARLQR